MNYTFKTVDGLNFTVFAKDGDRARSAAKALALSNGFAWKGAKLVKITNALG